MTVVPCPECAADVAPGAKFCPECGVRQPERPAPSREVRKLVTVLFADVTGSTALGEQLDPEALRSLMNRYFARMRIVIEAHGGTVEKFIGDAVMAVFGIPQVHEDDALRAVRAAAEIRDALAAMNEELERERGIAIRFRTGVNTGEVVAGDPESGTTLVTGDTVNTAARLEQAAPPGEILLGKLTYSLVRDAVDAEPVDPIAAKGKAQAVEAYRLVSVRAGAEGRARHLDAPMVGRDKELSTLTDAWRKAVDERTPHLVTLVAPAGVGKSRLVREFIERVRQDGGQALVGRCLSYGEGITYWPVRELVHQAAGITEADDRDAAGERITDLFAGRPDGTRLAARVATVVGLSAEPAPQEELFWAVRRMLEQVAADRPILVVLEDLHWAEDTLLDLVEYVVDLAANVPLLVLATARPDLIERRPAFVAPRQTATVIRLEPLGADAAGELLAALPGGAAVPDALRARILDAAEGTPLYVEEFLGLLRDDGLIVADGEGWRATGAIDAVAVPASIQALLAARLEALPEPERVVAQRASVIGRSFEVAALAELERDRGSGQLGRNLLALVRKELLRPDRPELAAGDAFRFRHVLIRDAAYEALPKAERAALHERFADWLELAAGDRMTEVEEIAGHHLRLAHQYRVELGETGDQAERLADRAATRLAAAGTRAGRNGDWHASAELLEAAVTLATLDRVPLGYVARLADTLIDISALDRAKVWLDAGREESTRRGSAAEAARIRLAESRWASYTLHEDQETDDAELQSIQAVLEAAGDHEGLAAVWDSFSGVHWAGMRAEAAAAATARAAEELGLAGNHAAADAHRAWHLMLTTMGPAPGADIEGICRAVIDDPGAGIRLRAMAHESLSSVSAGDGRFDEARMELAESRRLVDELNVPFHRALKGFTAAANERMAGDEAAAEREAREAREILAGIGELAYAAGLLAVLAQTLEAQDRDDEALELLGPDLPDYAYDGTLHRMVRAKIYAKRGALDDAVALGAEAVVLADTTDVTALRAEARLELARVFLIAGRDAEARSTAAEAARLYREKGVSVMAEVAEHLDTSGRHPA